MPLGRSVLTVTTVGVHSYDGRFAQLWRSVCTVGASTDRHGRAALAACPGLTRAAESSVHPRVRPPGRFPGSVRAGKRGCRSCRAGADYVVVGKVGPSLR